jgi:hypothetical protein
MRFVASYAVLLLGCGASSFSDDVAADSDADADVDADADGPPHAEGSYAFGCDPSGCAGGTRCFQGDDGELNGRTECSVDWATVYVSCTVEDVGGGATRVTAFVSDRPLPPASDAGRSGIQIVASSVASGVTDPYHLVLWDPPGDYHVDTQSLTEGQGVCTTYSVSLVGPHAFTVDFDCPDMRTTFDLPAHYTRLGHVAFSGCR